VGGFVGSSIYGLVIQRYAGFGRSGPDGSHNAVAAAGRNASSGHDIAADAHIATVKHDRDLKSLGDYHCYATERWDQLDDVGTSNAVEHDVAPEAAGPIVTGHAECGGGCDEHSSSTAV
jgi:hypothetical protein